MAGTCYLVGGNNTSEPSLANEGQTSGSLAPRWIVEAVPVSKEPRADSGLSRKGGWQLEGKCHCLINNRRVAIEMRARAASAHQASERGAPDIEEFSVTQDTRLTGIVSRRLVRSLRQRQVEPQAGA
jgi:hypothetical protein